MSYYYLIASLPDLSLEMATRQIDFDKTIELIHRNLTPGDQQLFRYLIYPNDIKNLLMILFQEHQDLPMGSFKRPSVLTQEEVEGYRHYKSNFPGFIHDFLIENEDRFATMTMQEMEDILLAGFNEEIATLDNNFIIEYFNFSYELKSLVSAYNLNAYEFLSKPTFKDTERFIGQIGPDRSPTTSISKDYPYLEELIQAMSTREPEESERFIDRVIWDFLEDRNNGIFSNKEVFAYFIKLQITQRWTFLDRESGSIRFEELYREIKENVRSSKTPVI